MEVRPRLHKGYRWRSSYELLQGMNTSHLRRGMADFDLNSPPLVFWVMVISRVFTLVTTLILNIPWWWGTLRLSILLEKTGLCSRLGASPTYQPNLRRFGSCHSGAQNSFGVRTPVGYPHLLDQAQEFPLEETKDGMVQLGTRVQLGWQRTKITQGKNSIHTSPYSLQKMASASLNFTPPCFRLSCLRSMAGDVN